MLPIAGLPPKPDKTEQAVKRGDKEPGLSLPVALCAHKAPPVLEPSTSSGHKNQISSCPPRPPVTRSQTSSCPPRSACTKSQNQSCPPQPRTTKRRSHSSIGQNWPIAEHSPPVPARLVNARQREQRCGQRNGSRFGGGQAAFWVSPSPSNGRTDCRCALAQQLGSPHKFGGSRRA